MHQPIPVATSLPNPGSPINKPAQRWRLITFACVLAPLAQAVTPPPVGGYLNKNTAVGQDALFSLQSFGFSNTACGYQTLYSNTNGSDNIAVGDRALYLNTTGNFNIGIGLFALYSNITGSHNVAVGTDAMDSNTIGGYNTGLGSNSLAFNSTGGSNSAYGFRSLYSNTSGSTNTAGGYEALYTNTTGSENTAIGSSAMARNKTGTHNIALDANAGVNLTTGNNNIMIGAFGFRGEDATIRLGRNEAQTKTYIAGIFGATIAGGTSVVVDSSGHIGTITSSERFKQKILPMDSVSEAIFSLNPVTFTYKDELDPAGISQFGLIAEEVEKVDPSLVARDGNGKVYTVRYEAVNAMLLNEFLKEHRRVEKQAAEINEQQTTISGVKSAFEQQAAIIAQQQTELKTMAATLKEQATLIRMVSNRMDAEESSPQLASQ